MITAFVRSIAVAPVPPLEIKTPPPSAVPPPDARVEIVISLTSIPPEETIATGPASPFEPDASAIIVPVAINVVEPVF